MPNGINSQAAGARRPERPFRPMPSFTDEKMEARRFALNHAASW